MTGSEEMLESAATVELVNTLGAADDCRRAFFVTAARVWRLAALFERVLAADEAALDDVDERALFPLACECESRCSTFEFELVDAEERTPLALCFEEALLEQARGRRVADTTCLFDAPPACMPSQNKAQNYENVNTWQQLLCDRKRENDGTTCEFVPLVVIAVAAVDRERAALAPASGSLAIEDVSYADAEGEPM